MLFLLMKASLFCELSFPHREKWRTQRSQMCIFICLSFLSVTHLFSDQHQAKNPLSWEQVSGFVLEVPQMLVPAMQPFHASPEKPWVLLPESATCSNQKTPATPHSKEYAKTFAIAMTNQFVITLCLYYLYALYYLNLFYRSHLFGC